MFLNKIIIEPASSAGAIVKQNHHTADVFRKYGIEYCCGGNWPLSTVCADKELDFGILKHELEAASHTVQLPPALQYEKWNTDFLINYIVHIHHQFLKNTIADTSAIINDFAQGHKKQYPEMPEVAYLFQQFNEQLMPHLRYEEETIFPYIRQIAHAYENKDSYARLLVKTLRKPLNNIRENEEESLSARMLAIRQLTNNYLLPEKSCVSHVLALSRLKDLDNDLMQHIYLENEILFVRALKIESELLSET